MRKGIMESFTSRVKLAANGCWEWQGHIDAQGYGRFYYIDVDMLAHRFIMQACGHKIDGFHVHHVCENTRCVNPNHLKVLTRNQHIQASPRFPAYYALKFNQCKRGHAFDSENTLICKDGSRKCRACQALSRSQRCAQWSVKKSDYFGIAFSRETGKWVARINIHHQLVHLALVDDESEAAYIYDQVAFQLRGESAKLNTPF